VGGGALAKESNLAREAAHYKVNAERIFGELKEKPTAKTAKSNASNSHTSEKTKARAKKR
jgi:hypothetical protein